MVRQDSSPQQDKTLRPRVTSATVTKLEIWTIPMIGGHLELTNAAKLNGDRDSNPAKVGAVLGGRVTVVTSRAGLGSGLGVGRRGVGASASNDGSRADGDESAGNDGFGKHFDWIER